jgi:predicted DNA binding CopG/RHH family protein
MKRKLPELQSDEAAETFVTEADLTQFDLSGMQPAQFEFRLKSERVNMRLPRALLDAVRASAAKQGVPYQRFIRQALEAAVTARKSS